MGAVRRAPRTTGSTQRVRAPTATATPNGSCPTIAEDNGFDPECNWCAQADLLNNALRNSRTVFLKPGQGFVLHGVIAELHWNADGISSCDRAKNNNPRLGNGD